MIGWILLLIGLSIDPPAFGVRVSWGLNEVTGERFPVTETFRR